MRVLVNMPSQYGGRPSGVALVVFKLLEELLTLGRHEYVLRSPWSREQLPPALAASSLTVVERPRPRLMILDTLVEALRMPAICRQLGVDVVLNADPFGAARGAKARVTIAHDLYFHTLPEQVGGRATLTMALAYDLVLNGSTRIVTVSDATRTDLGHWRPRFGAKARTIHSDAATSPAPANPARVGPARYVLLVGNATPNKNFALAARAFAEIRPSFPDLEIVHVGQDGGETINAELTRLGVDTPVIRLTNVPDGDLKALYRDAVAYVAPSLSEGFCLPILEAQSQDCPVVCSNASALPEIAGDGALFFAPNDSQALAGHLRSLLETPDLGKALAERGRANRGRFSWKQSAVAYERVLEDALAASRRNF
ncbi:glycosyltransferase family 4 protein [Caulobacter sp. UC70_42]|uniref:glycosyltransferase family 4 protein n=1 Tax=Caulobacter sp. UC70_42 TaxID=3374551 RepID=UPI0037564320